MGGGHRSGAKRRKTVFGRALPLFGSKSTISRFGERFCYGQYTAFSVSCLLFFYSRCPHAQTFVKVGARAPVPHGVGATAQNLRVKYAEYSQHYINCLLPDTRNTAYFTRTRNHPYELPYYHYSLSLIHISEPTRPY